MSDDLSINAAYFRWMANHLRVKADASLSRLERRQLLRHAAQWTALADKLDAYLAGPEQQPDQPDLFRAES